MTQEIILPPDVGLTLERLRKAAGLTQAQLAERAGIDQSRISRIEKREPTTAAEATKVIEALASSGSGEAGRFLEFIRHDWSWFDRPMFHNPQLTALEMAHKTFEAIHKFLTASERPWPLVRQIERQKEALHSEVSFLQNLSHTIAFVGNIGVGKSTAISFLFKLLASPTSTNGPLDRVVLETGGGRTTICEVSLRRGPNSGLLITPQTDTEIRDLVRDFCSSVWNRLHSPQKDADEAVQVSEEVGRAIRNMAALTVKRERTADGTRVTHDTARDLANSCSSEEEFRARVIDRMQLPQRTRREIWYEPAADRDPLRWLADIFKSVNNGRVPDAPLPRSIDILLPAFSDEALPLEVSVTDTKGIDDVAIRPDITARLTDRRSIVVFCSSFNDAPGTTTLLLTEHLRKSLGERATDGRIAILVLPRSGEAMAVKDDSGNRPEDDLDGYDLKRQQIRNQHSRSDLGQVSVLFFNAASTDKPDEIRSSLFDMVLQLRGRHSDRISDIAATIDDLIKNFETQAITAAIEEVAKRLSNFLQANRVLKPTREPAYADALLALEKIRYAATIWASTRRNGDWPSFDVYHLIGYGGGRQAQQRSNDWFIKLSGQIESLKSDSDLALARRLIDQIERHVEDWKRDFIDSARSLASETYRDNLKEDQEMWSACAGEWGRGSGFKTRVQARLKKWFEDKDSIREKLDSSLQTLWTERVVKKLEQLCDEGKSKIKQSK